ncbi:MAG TPA: KR domain-containing protein, partial [Rugosimonospora sp.]|nr:KR domain-containing protein [Rugosimonospora sp.]
APLAGIDPDRLLAATGATADGAWHLHRETQSDDLDFFVLFSSFAAQLGTAAAGARATAGEFLNGLARHRRAAGLPATSVGWGPVERAGAAPRSDGQTGLTPAQVVAELGTLLHTRPVNVSIVDIDWQRWAQANPRLAQLPRFGSLVPSGEPDRAPAEPVRSKQETGRVLDAER